MKRRYTISILVIISLACIYWGFTLVSLRPPQVDEVSTTRINLKMLALGLEQYRRTHNGMRPSSFSALKNYVLMGHFTSKYVEVYRPQLKFAEYMYWPNAQHTQPVIANIVYYGNTQYIYWLDATGKVYIARSWNWPKWMRKHGAFDGSTPVKFVPKLSGGD